MYPRQQLLMYLTHLSPYQEDLLPEYLLIDEVYAFKSVNSKYVCACRFQDTEHRRCSFRQEESRHSWIISFPFLLRKEECQNCFR